MCTHISYISVNQQCGYFFIYKFTELYIYIHIYTVTYSIGHMLILINCYLYNNTYCFCGFLSLSDSQFYVSLTLCVRDACFHGQGAHSNTLEVTLYSTSILDIITL